MYNMIVNLMNERQVFHPERSTRNTSIYRSKFSDLYFIMKDKKLFKVGNKDGLYNIVDNSCVELGLKFEFDEDSLYLDVTELDNMFNITIMRGSRRIEGQKNHLGYQGKFLVFVDDVEVGSILFKDNKLVSSTFIKPYHGEITTNEKGELDSITREGKKYDLITENNITYSPELLKSYKFDRNEMIFYDDDYHPGSYYEDKITWFNLVNGKISKDDNHNYSYKTKIEGFEFFFDIEDNKILSVASVDPINMKPVNVDGYCQALNMRFWIERYEVKHEKIRDEITEFIEQLDKIIVEGDKRYHVFDGKLIKKEIYQDGKLKEIKLY